VINVIRAHLAEFGIVSKVSKAQLARIVSEVDLELICVKRNRRVFG
jgi:hypothetical protein